MSERGGQGEGAQAANEETRAESEVSHARFARN
jgi:hypothetical protein